MVSSFTIVSDDAVHQPTWSLLLEIEHMIKLQVLGNNSKTVNNIKNLTWGKNDQHSKIYLSCNFEVDLITHLGKVKFKFQKCAACQDLPTLQFLSKFHYPFWSYFPFFIKFSKS